MMHINAFGYSTDCDMGTRLHAMNLILLTTLEPGQHLHVQPNHHRFHSSASTLLITQLIEHILITNDVFNHNNIKIIEYNI